jgi:hypothetical protein
MGDVINLRQVRKARARAEREKIAAENRAKFGRPGHERTLTDAERQRYASHVDGARRDADDDDLDPGTAV